MRLLTPVRNKTQENFTPEMLKRLSKLVVLLAILLATCIKATIGGPSAPQKIITTTIDPSQPTSSWNNRFASFADLLSAYYNLKYSQPTLLLIKIPAGATVNVLQTSFSMAQNLEAQIQGADRKTSVLKFDSTSYIFTNNMNLTITNVSMTAEPRQYDSLSTATKMFSTGNASLAIIDSDIDFSRLGSMECSLELNPNYKMMHVENTLLIRGVNASFGGLVALVEETSIFLDIAIENSVFTLTSVSNYFVYLNYSNDDIPTVNNTVSVNSTIFHVSNSCGLVNGTNNVGLFYIGFLQAATLENITLYVEDNYAVHSFVTFESIKQQAVRGFDAKLYGENTSFYRIIQGAFVQPRYSNCSEISDVTFEGRLQPHNLLASENNPSFLVECATSSMANIIVRNIQAKNLILNNTGLLAIQLTGYSRLSVDDVTVSHSTILYELIHIRYTGALKTQCSQNTPVPNVPVNGIKILNSNITTGNGTLKIIDFYVDCSLPKLTRPFMSTLNLSGWRFINNTIRFRNTTHFDSYFEKLTVVSSYGSYLFLHDLIIDSNVMFGVYFFRIEGTSPIIRLSSATIQNNRMTSSALISKESNKASFLCSLEYNPNTMKILKIPNFRFLMIENSTIRGLNAALSTIAGGDFPNVYVVNNSFDNFDINISTLFNLRYSPCKERAPEPFDFTQLMNSSRFFDGIPTAALTKFPLMVFAGNNFTNMNISQVSVLNNDGFDYFKMLNEYHSKVYFTNNRFENISDDTSNQYRNLFNFWCGGEFTLTENDFTKALVQGYIFSFKNDECDARTVSIDPGSGTFEFNRNVFDGEGRDAGSARNQTGILEFSMGNILIFNFTENFISNSQILNRGIIHVVLSSLKYNTHVFIEGNMFVTNRFRVDETLQGNYFTIKAPPYEGGGVRGIYFISNSFLLSTIDGDPNFLGSMLSLTPSLVHIEAPDFIVFINYVKFINTVFSSFGFLGMIVADTINIKNSSIIGTTFNDNPILRDISSEHNAKHGIFFCSSKYIFIDDSTFESNSVSIGSFFFLDNFWPSSMVVKDETQEITFQIFNVVFKRNLMEKGAVITYSGGSFGVNLLIDKIDVDASGKSVGQFILIDDPKAIRVRIINSRFAFRFMLYSGTDVKRTHSIFSFKNLYFASSNMSIPITVDNCTFQFRVASSPLSSVDLLPKFQITNSDQNSSNSLIKFTNCNFSSTYSKGQQDSTGLQFELVGSKLLMENCTFTDLILATYNMFHLTNSSLTIMNSTFTKSYFGSAGGIINSAGSNVTLEGVSASENHFEMPAIFIVAQNLAITTKVNNSNFSANFLTENAAFIHIRQRNGVGSIVTEVHETLFENNTLEENATCILNEEEGCLIDSCVFRRNEFTTESREANGAAIRNWAFGIATVRNCTFEENVATKGGAIYSSEAISITDSRFSNNYAFLAGGAIFIGDCTGVTATSTIINNTYSGNTAFYLGHDHVGTPNYLEYQIPDETAVDGITLLPVSNQTRIPIIANFTPGANFSHTIKVFAYDIYGNRLTEVVLQDSFTATLQMSVVDRSFLNNETVDPSTTANTPYYYSTLTWTTGALVINGSHLRLTAPFQQFVLINITTNLAGKSLILLLLAQANPTCNQGQVFMSSSMICQTCKSGWYSRNSSETACLPCPTAATCYSEGGYDVSIKQGYWANMSKAEIIAYKCENNDRACVGGNNSECEVGYTGLLCEDCAYFGVNGTGPSYTRSGRFQCNSCPSSTKNVVVFALVLFFTVLGEVIFIYINIHSNEKYVKQMGRNSDEDEEKNPTGVYFRLLATYMQILGIIQTFNFQLPSFITSLFSVGNPANSVFYSSQCIVIEIMKTYQLTEWMSLPYFSTLFVFGILAVKLLFYSLIWVGLRFCFRSKMKYRYLVVAIISIFFLEQPSLLTVLYGIISCRSIDKQSVLARFPSFACSTPENNLFFYAIAMPLLALISLLLPLGVLVILIRGRHQIRSRAILLKYGTLISEYKPKYFYWAFVLMWFKFALISLSNIFPNTTEMDLKFKALGLIFVFALYLVAINNIRPYVSDQVYTMDKYLNYLNISTIFFAYLSLSKNEDGDFMKVIYGVCFSVIVTTNIAFLTYSSKLIYQANVKHAKKVLNRVTTYIKKKARRSKESEVGSSFGSTINEGLINSFVEESPSSSIISSEEQSMSDNISLQNIQTGAGTGYDKEVREQL